MSDTGIEEIERATRTESEESTAITITLERTQDRSYRGVIANSILDWSLD